MMVNKSTQRCVHNLSVCMEKPAEISVKSMTVNEPMFEVNCVLSLLANLHIESIIVMMIRP